MCFKPQKTELQVALEELQLETRRRVAAEERLKRVIELVNKGIGCGCGRRGPDLCNGCLLRALVDGWGRKSDAG
jgi:hypothetical protein